MILLTLDEEKLLTIAMVPYIPNQAVIVMAAQAGPGDFDKIKLLPQLQILRRKDLSVIESATLTMEELSQLFHLAKAVGVSLGAAAVTVDKNFDTYRKLVLNKNKIEEEP